VALETFNELENTMATRKNTSSKNTESVTQRKANKTKKYIIVLDGDVENRILEAEDDMSLEEQLYSYIEDRFESPDGSFLKDCRDIEDTIEIYEIHGMVPFKVTPTSDFTVKIIRE